MANLIARIIVSAVLISITSIPVMFLLGAFGENRSYFDSLWVSYLLLWISSNVYVYLKAQAVK